MAYLNADIPPIYCKIRKEYLYDLEKHQGESVDCCVFSMVSITDRALLFNIMLPNGACFWRLPISAFFQEKFESSVRTRTKHPFRIYVLLFARE